MDESITKQKYVVIYPGRFQPFHTGHKEIYDVLTRKFGKENVYIATSNKVELPKSPFNFSEKKKIITTMFKDIPVDHIVEVKSTYSPKEVTGLFPETTPAIFVVGAKDAERLKGFGDYYKPYSDTGNMDGYRKHGYYYIVDNKKIKMSGTKVREMFQSGDTKSKEEAFKKLYGDMNKEVFNLLSKKIVKESENQEKEINIKDDTTVIRFGKETEKRIIKDYKNEEQSKIIITHYDDKGNAWLKHWGLTTWMIPKENLKESEIDDGPSFLKEDAPSFLLMEGGAYGHLSHFHDIKTNTFADLREFIDTVLQGKMEYARIKTDGMNLMFSFIDGHLRAARNTSDLKNFGKNSLTMDSLNKKFEGRGAIQKSFVAAARDLQHAIGKLPKAQVDEIFENGKNWMSVEIMHPNTQNVIPYGVYELRFHGIRKYDEKGNIVGEDKAAADKLAKMIADIKQNKQDTFEIKSLEVASFPPLPDFKAQRAYFDKKVDALQREFGMKDKNTIADAFRVEFEKLIKTHAREARYTIPKAELTGLVNRWAFNDTSFKARDIQSIKNETFRDWALDFDKEGAGHFAKEISNKFEYLTLELGARVLKNLSSFMVANPQKSVQELKKGIDDVIRQVQASKNPELIDKMKYELERLASIGGVNAIAPEEGVTFMFKDHFYKLTGAFAPINQIMNLRYKVGNKEDKEVKDKETVKESFIVSEGGNAFDGTTSIPQNKIQVTIDDLVKKVLNPMGFTERGEDWDLLGSALKKSDASGDIDVGINTYGDSFTKNKIQTFLNKNKIENVYFPASNTISIKYPIVGTDKYVQIDLMLTSDMEYTKWARHSPHQKDTSVKAKFGTYRNILLNAIAHGISYEVKEKNPDGKPKVIERMVMDFDNGLFRKVEDFTEKNLKKAKTLKRTLVSRNPQKIVKTILGSQAKVEDADSYDSLWSFINSEKFPYKDKLNIIKDKYKTSLEKAGMDIPKGIK